MDTAGPAMPGGTRAGDLLVPLLFFGSGVAGLIYQVVWTRELVLVFGDTAQAIVTTVTAFLGGLGAGALVGGRIARRLSRPLAAYGLVELFVGACALFMPLAFDAVASAFRSAYLSLPAGEVALIRFALSVCVLAPVTVAMGMTLPLLTAYLVRHDLEVGSRIARLYALNTFGGAAGALVGGFVLIGVLGLRGASLVAVALNAVAGAGALAISTRVPASPSGLRPDPARRSRSGARQRVILAVTFTSGTVSLALEVLWTRVLVQSTGSSIYVFAAILASFLAGIGVGGLVYEGMARRRFGPATLGACLAGAAALALVPVVGDNLIGPHALAWTVPSIAPVTALLGFAFPLTARLYVGAVDEAAPGVGAVYAANTAGCVVGAVTAGFVLLPEVGANVSVIVLAAFEALVGAALVAGYAPRRGRVAGAATALVLALAIAAMAAVPAVRLTYPQRFVAGLGHPAAHFDDPVASVDVVGGPPASRQLLVNGIGVTRLTIDTKLLAYLPKALRPSASRALVICLGMGTTFRSSLVLGMRTDAVELDPTVPAVMSWFYPDAAKWLHSPLARVIVADGRNYVRLSDDRYDIIAVDAPPPLWTAGAVVLMTHEFYAEAAARLEPHGVVALFLQDAGLPDTRLILRTFRATFPDVLVLRGLRNFGYFVLGSDAPLVFVPSSIMRIFGSAAAQADLAGAPDFPATPTSAWPGIVDRMVWLRGSQVDAFAGPGPLLTDDHPYTEYYLVH